MNFEHKPTTPSSESFTGHPTPAVQLEPGMHSIDHDKEIFSVTDNAGGYLVTFVDHTSI